MGNIASASDVPEYQPGLRVPACTAGAQRTAAVNPFAFVARVCRRLFKGFGMFLSATLHLVVCVCDKDKNVHTHCATLCMVCGEHQRLVFQLC